MAAYAARGFRALARNWRCPIGEIDLVVQRGSLIVVCEVKARSGVGYGGPYEAVTATKRRRLRTLAAAFLQTMPAGLDRRSGFDVRFDVASVTLDADGRPLVHLFEDAF